MVLTSTVFRRNAPQFLDNLRFIEEVNPMTFHSETLRNTVGKKERLLNQTNRQQSRNRQRSMLMRSIQQVETNQI